ncbi:hypothetical protein [Nitrobacter sp.]|uniref:hypothetical protein n=1 Tax=Nitrobacter sp. TaxID=29420 RepID=UPI0029CAC72C|nr:hypothetical protein [Nitrobacter sp.]
MRAQIQILSIRKTQSQAFAELVKAPEGDQPKAVRRLGALDRYERYALALRQRARQIFENCQNEASGERPVRMIERSVVFVPILLVPAAVPRLCLIINMY